MRKLLMVSVFLSVPAYAAPSEEDIKKAVVRLTTAFQCAPVIDDDGPYVWAKANAALLIGAEKSAEIIAYVEGQGREGSPLNERMCRNMTKNYRD